MGKGKSDEGKRQVIANRIRKKVDEGREDGTIFRSVNRPINVNGDTLLHFACYSGDVQLVARLLAYGADRDIPNNSGNLPLRHATDEVKAFLDKNKDNTKAYYACEANDLDYTAYCLAFEENFPPNYASKFVGRPVHRLLTYGRHAIHYAILANVPIVSTLLATDFMKAVTAEDIAGNRALHLLGRRGDINTCKQIIQEYAEKDSEQLESFVLKANNSQQSVFDLVESKLGINKANELHQFYEDIASKNKEDSTVDVEALGCAVPTPGSSVVSHEAEAASGDVPRVTNVDFADVVVKGDARIKVFVKQYGVDAQDKEGNTLLHHAYKQALTGGTLALINELGARDDIANDKGQTAQDLSEGVRLMEDSAQQPHRQNSVVEVAPMDDCSRAKQMVSDPESFDPKYLVTRGDKVIQAYLDAGGNVDQQQFVGAESKGDTMLHIAYMLGNRKNEVELLLKSRARDDIENQSGKTAAQYKEELLLEQERHESRSQQERLRKERGQNHCCGCVVS